MSSIKEYDAAVWLYAVISQGFTVFSVFDLKKHNLFDMGFVFRAKSADFIRKAGRTRVPNSSPRNRWEITDRGFRYARQVQASKTSIGT